MKEHHWKCKKQNETSSCKNSDFTVLPLHPLVVERQSKRCSINWQGNPPLKTPISLASPTPTFPSFSSLPPSPFAAQTLAARPPPSSDPSSQALPPPRARRPSDPRLRACLGPHGGGDRRRARRRQGAGAAAAAPALRSVPRRVPQLRRARDPRRGDGGGHRPQDASEFWVGTGGGALVLKFAVVGVKTLERGRC